ncbi:sigma-70 family RNA polymerase sigma factor [Arthrobacter sp. NamB2]|uniref:sigma-70 family RNA polymerase sigma factor n=1 Tax=Arthrobacter sp. NamB2 TaxID=2576035 RepID=UPI0010C944B9|nr:sigma-70 family RNA polymerase sigma factor [Arthrobacter sp. NamB2]TKV29059.1 sigma-70 family RNA polymerase sigma factor [Arthrobacter sp. NamB2]
MQPAAANDVQVTDPGTGSFDQLLEASRRDLTGYCYRMLGAASEAEDAVQETMIKAWSRQESFAGQSSLRTWLFRIAHNVCVDMLRSPQRRARPMDLGPSTRTADAVLGTPLMESVFVQPIPDERVIDTSGDPAVVAEARDTIRLAFVAALQHLPPLQRSVLILCEVLRWSAAEVATLLEVTTASVNSALQRARKTMAGYEPSASMPLEDPAHKDLLAKYLRAFEAYDMAALVSLLRDDVVLSMPPFNLWLRGPDDVRAWFVGEGRVCEGGRLLPLPVNGAGGFANYHLVEPGLWEAFALQVIETDGERIIGHHNFLYPDMFEAFGLPLVIDERDAQVADER